MAELRQSFNKSRSVLFQLPTGGGKTVVFSYIAQAATSRGARICVLVHRAELRDQASRTLAGLGVEHGVIGGKQDPDETQTCWVGTIQTVSRRLERIPSDLFDLLIVDEAHHGAAKKWRSVLDAFPAARVLGVSATPCRLDGLGLGDVFDDLVCGPQPGWLIDNGFLADARVFAPPLGFDPRQAKRRGNDYDMGDAEDQIRTKYALGDCVKHYQEHLEGKTAIAFCCSIAHAEAVAATFNEHGITARSIDGRMKSAERAELLADLGSGAIKVLTSCELIGEGLDVPSVGGCILLRPTLSVALFLQMVGRCLRPKKDGSCAIVLDHVGNYARHGHHAANREWSLEKGARKKRQGEIAMSLWVCTSCFATSESKEKVCRECGSAKPVIEERVQTVEGRLLEIRLQRELEMNRKKQELREKRKEQAQCRTYQDLVNLAVCRGHRKPHAWAQKIMQARRRKSVW